MERYTNLATQASVIAGFSFESLVELEVPEGTHWALAGMYFIFGSMAMALALYCLVVASFACVFGHRLALQGPHGSLEIAVSILIAHRQHIFSVGGLSLACLVMAAVLMSWIKMGAAAGVVTLIFLIFAAATFHRMVHMARVFEIKDIDLVTGAVRIADPSSRGAGVDLARLNPGSRKVAPAMAAPPQPKQDRYQPLMDEEEVPKKKRSSGLGWFSPKASQDDASSSTAYSPGMPGRQPPGSASGGDGGGGVGGGAMITHEGHLYKKGDGTSALGTRGRLQPETLSLRLRPTLNLNLNLNLSPSPSPSLGLSLAFRSSPSPRLRLHLCRHGQRLPPPVLRAQGRPALLLQDLGGLR